MNRTADVSHSDKLRGVGEVKMEKGLAHIPPAEDTRSLWVLGKLLTYKIPSHSTGEAYSLFEVTTPPGPGPPPHVNHRENECFYVLEGEYEFSSSGETLRAGAGSLLYVPEGALHAHANWKRLGCSRGAVST